MEQRPQRLSVLTGFATVGAVLAGFGENLLTDDVPKDWRPAAWLALLIAVAFQLFIASQERRGWILSSLSVLLGFPIGIAVNVVVADLPQNIRLTWTLVFVAAFLLVVLASAVKSTAISRPRLPGVWSVLVALMWMFLGIVFGTVGAVLSIPVINTNGGIKATPSLDGGNDLMINLLCFPLVGSVFASWVSGKIRTGVYSGILSIIVMMMITSAYYYPIEEMVSRLGEFIATILGCSLIGILPGLFGGLVGVGLHKVRWWASSNAHDFAGT